MLIIIMDGDGVKLDDYAQQFSVIGTCSYTGSIHRNEEASLKGCNAKQFEKVRSVGRTHHFHLQGPRINQERNE
jgi:hypothetical protein